MSVIDDEEQNPRTVPHTDGTQEKGKENLACSDATSTSSSEEEDCDSAMAPFPKDVLNGVPGNIHMENTQDVQIGPRLLYNAPVTVHQHINVRGGEEQILQHAFKAPLEDIDLKTPNIHGVPLQKTGDVSYEGHAPSWLLSKGRWLLMSFAALLVLVIVLVVSVLATSSKSDGFVSGVDSTSIPPPPTDLPKDSNLTLPVGRIYTKADWYGQPPKYERTLRHPTPFIVISHTVTDPCYTFTDCAQQMRNMQDHHVSLKLPDLGFNFVVGNDGNVYEARGWDATNMHTGFVTRCNIAISLVGNFVYDIPTVNQLNSTKELINLGVKLGKISRDYKLVPMSKTDATESPGKYLYEDMKKWPHFWEPSEKEIGICPFDVE